MRSYGELLLRDLRAQHGIVAAPSDLCAPPIHSEQLTLPAYAVVLMTVREDDGRGDAAYVRVPASRYVGELAGFALLAAGRRLEASRRDE